MTHGVIANITRIVIVNVKRIVIVNDTRIAVANITRIVIVNYRWNKIFSWEYITYLFFFTILRRINHGSCPGSSFIKSMSDQNYSYTLKKSLRRNFFLYNTISILLLVHISYSFRTSNFVVLISFSLYYCPTFSVISQKLCRRVPQPSRNRCKILLLYHD